MRERTGLSSPAYEVIAGFAARLAARGVSDVVVSPGSRSTALTLCFDAQPSLRTWIQIDERSAGFFALGLGRASGIPAVLVCTSGTAAANYLPAVVEASHAGVPMIVCTADRPPELRNGWGAQQTIDQINLYGTAVRLSRDLPVPEAPDVAAAVEWADDAFDSATGVDPGPVHLNWPLREPLEPPGPVPVITGGGDAPGSVEPQASSGAAVNRNPKTAVAELRQLAELAHEFERGVVVVGPWPGLGMQREQCWAAEMVRFAAWANWPVIGEPISHVRGEQARAGSPTGARAGSPTGARAGSPTGARTDVPTGARGGSPMSDRAVIPSGARVGLPTSTRAGSPTSDSLRSCVVTAADHLLADPALGDEMAPDVVVLAGRTITTKPVRLWIERTRPDHVVLIDPEDRWQRAVFRLTGHVTASADQLSAHMAELAPPERNRTCKWLDTWRQMDITASEALKKAIEQGPLLSAQTTKVLVAALPPDSVLMASNSMPVRDLDAFVSDTGSLLCCANRGAAGIDGTISTALGIAAADPSRTVALYIGDLAMLHDLSGLVSAARLGLHLTVVCVDNDGGEIFSLLPVADCIPTEDFERLFRTPHGLDLSQLNGFAGIRTRRVGSAAALRAEVQKAAVERRPGVDVLVVQIPRDDDIAQRRTLTAAAQKAIRRVV